MAIQTLGVKNLSIGTSGIATSQLGDCGESLYKRDSFVFVPSLDKFELTKSKNIANIAAVSTPVDVRSTKLAPSIELLQVLGNGPSLGLIQC